MSSLHQQLYPAHARHHISFWSFPYPAYETCKQVDQHGKDLGWVCFGHRLHVATRLWRVPRWRLLLLLHVTEFGPQRLDHSGFGTGLASFFADPHLLTNLPFWCHVQETTELGKNHTSAFVGFVLHNMLRSPPLAVGWMNASISGPFLARLCWLFRYGQAASGLQRQYGATWYHNGPSKLGNPLTTWSSEGPCKLIQVHHMTWPNSDGRLWIGHLALLARCTAAQSRWQGRHKSWHWTSILGLPHVHLL